MVAAAAPAPLIITVSSSPSGRYFLPLVSANLFTRWPPLPEAPAAVRCVCLSVCLCAHRRGVIMHGRQCDVYRCLRERVSVCLSTRGYRVCTCVCMCVMPRGAELASWVVDPGWVGRNGSARLGRSPRLADPGRAVSCELLRPPARDVRRPIPRPVPVPSRPGAVPSRAGAVPCPSRPGPVPCRCRPVPVPVPSRSRCRPGAGAGAGAGLVSIRYRLS